MINDAMYNCRKQMSQKLKPYPEYKDSGIPWLGKVPMHWIQKPIQAITYLKNIRGRPDLPLLSVYRDYGVIRKDSRDDNYNPEGSDLSTYKVVKPGNLVLNKMKTWQGSLGVSNHLGIVSPAYIVCEIISDVYPHYIHYLLRSRIYVWFYNQISSGVRVNQWDMRYSDFKRIQIFLPPIEEQRQIANYLNKKEHEINRFIYNKRQLIKLLNEQKQAIINHAVTRGIDPNVRLKPSGVDWIGDIPEHWTVMPIRRAFESIDYGISESISDSGKIRVLTMGDINNGQVHIPETGGVDWVSDNLLLKDGDLLYNRTNSAELVGKVGLFKQVNTVQVTYASYLVRFRVKNINNSEFLNYLLNSPKILSIARQLAIPSLNQSNLNPTRYGRILIALPSLSDQIKIVSKINNDCAKIDKLIQINERQIKLICEYRIRLIADVVTGKIDVRGIPVEEIEGLEEYMDAYVSEELQEKVEIEETVEVLDAND
ncbi:MAG: hypothetical protein E3K36_16725 [Candidatus Brocadia sp.]|nr:hypothetical protein [Candidatus Brocadia sp.]